MQSDSMTAAQLDPEDVDEGPEHPQVRIRHGRRVADVDEGMAPLILACWRAGITTLHSCQDTPVQAEDGDGDYADTIGVWCYVHFPAPDADRFLRRVVRDEGDDELTDHAVGLDPDREDEMTDAEAVAFDLTYHWQWRAGAHGPDWERRHAWIGVSAYFPVADLPEVMRRLAGRRPG